MRGWRRQERGLKNEGSQETSTGKEEDWKKSEQKETEGGGFEKGERAEEEGGWKEDGRWNCTDFGWQALSGLIGCCRPSLSMADRRWRSCRRLQPWEEEEL